MDVLSSACASAAFVASFYVWPKERCFFRSGLHSLRTATQSPSIYVDRDSDETIRRRSLSFLQCCVVSGAYVLVRTPHVFSVVRGAEWQRPLCRAVGSTLLLFAGPIADKMLLREFALEESWLRRWRSYFICPIGEELFFRGVLFLLLQNRSDWTQITVAAVLFALSHSHHIVSWACDEYLDRVGKHSESEDDKDDPHVSSDEDLQRACWSAAARKLSFVYLFTGVFGVLSGYYYLRVCNRSIVAIAAVHAVCNVIGPPDFGVLRSPSTSALAKAVSALMYVGGVAGWLWSLLH